MTEQTLARCICGCDRSDEAMAERERQEAVKAAEAAINRAAFDLFWADREDGLPLLTPAEYRAKAEASR